jgi:hypothetical protein
MRYAISSGKGRVVPVLLPLCFVFLMALPSLLLASESCSMMGGKCRDACEAKEQSEVGDFEDCGPKQECCTVRPEVRCCVQSFATKDFGPANCRAPEGGACPKGSANAAPCDRLPMCSTAK